MFVIRISSRIFTCNAVLVRNINGYVCFFLFSMVVSFKGHTVVVTGAGGGLGRAYVLSKL